MPSSPHHVLLAVALLGVVPLGATARECLSYGPTNLVGRLARQTFPGPPDYADATRGDAARVIWVLLLDEPECVDGDPRALPQRLVREIELVWEPDQTTEWRDLLGKRVIVRGQLARGGALNDKRVVLVAREVERVRLGPGGG